MFNYGEQHILLLRNSHVHLHGLLQLQEEVRVAIICVRGNCQVAAELEEKLMAAAATLKQLLPSSLLRSCNRGNVEKLIKCIINVCHLVMASLKNGHLQKTVKVAFKDSSNPDGLSMHQNIIFDHFLTNWMAWDEKQLLYFISVSYYLTNLDRVNLQQNKGFYRRKNGTRQVNDQLSTIARHRIKRTVHLMITLNGAKSFLKTEQSQSPREKNYLCTDGEGRGGSGMHGQAQCGKISNLRRRGSCPLLCQFRLFCWCYCAEWVFLPNSQFSLKGLLNIGISRFFCKNSYYFFTILITTRRKEEELNMANTVV
ncbi:hypothetical protein EGR_06618 [Echinococcus granulosus]|uniref:Uncharacterized protein n=1 Tax=Echinococcus granulosus TaxID=6210 RepID=W6UY88_ECHGR|nr:hypothetical protein EGR_06618 [Echinococcus granulosus]EUB58529.1 hypothetical protein EGR_06618 [Echinococcus granulosus]